MKHRFLSAGIFLCAGLAYSAAPDGKQLFPAIRENDLTTLKTLIASGVDVNFRGDRETTPVMYAAAFGSLDALKTLVTAKADVNAKNAFAATALMWSVGEPAKVRYLVEHGADVNAKSQTGRTALMLAAMQNGSDEIVKLLLAKGADPLAADKDGMNFLLAASMGANPRQVEIALDRGADPNSRDEVRMTPLMNAAGNGDVASVRLLLAHHADVNAVSSAESSGKVKNGAIQLGKFTALSLAASYGPPQVVKLLLDAGAKADPVDVRGMTALHFAVSSERQDPAIVKMLLKAGVDPAVKTPGGETAGDWAAKFRMPSTMHLLPVAATSASPEIIAEPKSVQAHEAAQKSLQLLQKVSGDFIVTGGCMSCHGQNLTALAVSHAKKHGFAVNDEAQRGQLIGARAFFSSAADRLLLRFDPGGGADTVNYTLLHMAVAGYQPDMVSDALIHNVAAQQMAAGNWHRGGVARPPMEDSDITCTALSIRAFKTLAWKGRQADLDRRAEKAHQWLASAKPVHTEESAMQLLGLHWAGDTVASTSPRVRDLIAKQHSDGGWAQNAYLDSDAYATGQTVSALIETSALSPSDPVVQRAVQYLLRTQMPDGSWHVKSRSPKFQPYFQSGFPHDHDQWISMAGTAWATIALVDAGELVKVAEK